MSDEIWKPLPNSPGYYVSNKGNVKSPRKLLSPYICPKGYRAFSIVQDGVRKTRKGSRLVARAFIGIRDDMMVLHKNGNPSDDRLENLEYGTAKDNYRDAVRHGTNCQGGRHGNSLLDADKVREIRLLYKPGILGYAKLAQRYGVDKHTVKLVIKGKNWKHVDATRGMICQPTGDENE